MSLISFRSSFTWRAEKSTQSGAEFENRLACLLERTALRCAHARQQFCRIEWLGHVIIRAGIERGDLFIGLVADGKNQDRDIRPLPQMAEHFDSFHVG